METRLIKAYVNATTFEWLEKEAKAAKRRTGPHASMLLEEIHQKAEQQREAQS